MAHDLWTYIERCDGLWAYTERCDGDFCPMNCDNCPKAESSFEPDDADLEMGFDPYLGCYTDDC